MSAASMLSDRSKIQESLDQTSIWQRLQSLLGILGLLFITWLMSAHRRRVDWRLVSIGVGLQFLFGVLILVVPFGRPIFDAASAAFTKLLNFTKAGSGLIFGAFDQLQDSLLNTLAFGVLPTIIFFSSLMAVLYHLGLMQWVVNHLSWMMQRTMRTSGSETLSAAANIFVGQTEAPLMVRPYVSKMTQSELMAVMVGGFATVAGGVLAIYVGFLEPHFPGLAGHLLTASVMSAPAALVIAKVLYPEVEKSETSGHVKVKVEKLDANIIDAAARGAGEGLTLTLNVAAMLLAFVALIAALNYIIGLPSYIQHHSLLSEAWATLGSSGVELGAFKQCSPELVTLEGSQACLQRLGEVASTHQVALGEAWHVWSFQEFFGYLFSPLAMLIGIPYAEAWSVGQLLGVKVVLNELIAYQDLIQLVKSGGLSPRSVIITSYALCGFANFGSIAIQIGGIGGIAPDRRGDLARLGIKAMWGGTLAALMTGAVVGVLL
jgi:CNT family concentrative nucleoside transporter